MVVNGLTKQHAFEIGNGFYGLDIMKPQSQIMYGIKEFFAIILKFCTKSQDFVANINSKLGVIIKEKPAVVPCFFYFLTWSTSQTDLWFET